MTGFSPTVRRIIHERSEFWCERCGLKRGVQAHHRRPRGMGGTKRPETNQASAGVWLCLECHAAVESNRAAALSEGWLVPQNSDPATVPLLYRGSWVHLDDLGNMTEAYWPQETA